MQNYAMIRNLALTSSGLLLVSSKCLIVHGDSTADNDRRKIIVFGSSGDGKSTVVNCILNHEDVLTRPIRAKSGSSAIGVTFESTKYKFKVKSLDRKYAIVDTVGLNEADGGRVKSADALRKLTSLIVDQKKGIAAVVMVMKHERIKDYHKKNYELFVEDIGNAKAQKVPRVLVITHFEGGDEEKSEVAAEYSKHFAANKCYFDVVVVGRFDHHKNSPLSAVEGYVSQEKDSADKLLVTLTDLAVVNKQFRAPGWFTKWFKADSVWYKVVYTVVRKILVRYFWNLDMILEKFGELIVEVMKDHKDRDDEDETRDY